MCFDGPSLSKSWIKIFDPKSCCYGVNQGSLADFSGTPLSQQMALAFLSKGSSHFLSSPRPYCLRTERDGRRYQSHSIYFGRSVHTFVPISKCRVSCSQAEGCLSVCWRVVLGIKAERRKQEVRIEEKPHHEIRVGRKLMLSKQQQLISRCQPYKSEVIKSQIN